MCRYLHGTSPDRLESIQRHGLVGPDVVEQLGFAPTYRGISRPDHVYLIDAEHDYDDYPVGFEELPMYASALATAWGEGARTSRMTRPVVLCVDPVSEPEEDENMVYGTSCRKHKGGIPPERIRLHKGEGGPSSCTPLLEWAPEWAA